MPDEVVLDFSQVKPFEPLDPNGRYLVRCLKLEIGKAAGGPKSSCQLQVVSPEEVQVEEWVPDEDAEGGMRKVGMLVDDKGAPVMTKAKGRIFFREFSHQPQALPFLYEFIKAINPEAELGEDFKYNPKEYEGMEACCTIQNDAFGEQVRPRVKRMYPASTFK